MLQVGQSLLDSVDVRNVDRIAGGFHGKYPDCLLDVVVCDAGSPRHDGRRRRTSYMDRHDVETSRRAADVNG